MAQYMPAEVVRMLLGYWSDTVTEADVVLGTVEAVTGRPDRTLAEWARGPRRGVLLTGSILAPGSGR